MDPQFRKIQEHFSDWHRLAHKGHAPKQLIHEAVSLLSKHSARTVSVALQVPVNTLNTWRRRRVQESVDFVSLPIQEVKPEIESSHNTDFQLALPHGMQLSLKGQSIKKMAQLVRALVEELSTCSI